MCHAIPPVFHQLFGVPQNKEVEVLCRQVVKMPVGGPLK